jgi:DNA-binding LacI/PurR family transcriptional regulator
VRDIADPFFTVMLKVIAAEARRRGYNLVLGDACSSAEEAQALTQVLEVRHCEAILLVGDVFDEPRLLADLSGSNLTVVALCQGARAPGLSTVNAVGEAGARLAVEISSHLVTAALHCSTRDGSATSRRGARPIVRSCASTGLRAAADFSRL